jgi:hypothetical protein
MLLLLLSSTLPVLCPLRPLQPTFFLRYMLPQDHHPVKALPLPLMAAPAAHNWATSSSRRQRAYAPPLPPLLSSAGHLLSAFCQTSTSHLVLSHAIYNSAGKIICNGDSLQVYDQCGLCGGNLLQSSGESGGSSATIQKGWGVFGLQTCRCHLLHDTVEHCTSMQTHFTVLPPGLSMQGRLLGILHYALLPKRA